ncbi:hypothetical protein L798_11847 [Zootermopsis nevadensis]|uniref:Uncharacterized protein n=1 Tax=Zootermopsis nevadensis TaxID=136037 RepID=A0A067R4F9_ZOONE|nr:hypothetical protein L798_11847 [Zootermopsis nevadensis]
MIGAFLLFGVTDTTRDAHWPHKMVQGMSENGRSIFQILGLSLDPCSFRLILMSSKRMTLDKEMFIRIRNQNFSTRLLRNKSRTISHFNVLTLPSEQWAIMFFIVTH